MKRMRRYLYIMLALICVLSLAGCKKQGGSANTSAITSTSEPEIIVRPKEETSASSSSSEGTSVSISVSEDTGAATASSEDPAVSTTASEEPIISEEIVVSESTEVSVSVSEPETETTRYYFRSKKLLNQHYEKHGIDMGFSDAKSYEKAASDVINNPKALSKIQKEDGDFVYYVEETNEFAVLSSDGYIRTYFLPGSGKKYYDKQ